MSGVRNNGDKFHITTPIYYPDSKLHIGHTYTTVAADALARFNRLQGKDVFYLTGTDEHGQKIQQAAAEQEIEPQEFVDDMVDWIKSLWAELGISYDYFVRTTDKQHRQTVQDIFAKLHDQEDIYLSTYEGWYCTPCESFWLESKLEDGKCPDCNREVSWVEEDAYFLRLTRYSDALLNHIENNDDFIQPETRRNEVISFLNSGLEDMCVSRQRNALNWGITVPFDSEYVVYVWFDAVCNYISAIGYGGEGDSEEFNKWWPADVHLIGKEILRFHCVIWPIILMALDLPLPDQIFGHGWLTLGGEKMSKSRGNVVDPLVLSEKYGRDAVRYFLLREIPFGADGRYTERALIDRTNVDLANDLGNLLSRVTAMLNKYCDGTIPKPQELEHGQIPEVDRQLKKVAQQAVEGAEEALKNYHIDASLEHIWKLVGSANKYVDECAPWSLEGDEESRRRRDTVLYNLAEVLRILAIVMRPYLLDAPGEIWRQLGLDSSDTSIQETSWDDLIWGELPSGVSINRGEPLFPRIDPEEALQDMTEKDVQEEIEHLPAIDYDTFTDVELVVGRIVEAEHIEDADRLLRVVVNIGYGELRQVVAGIANHYSPEEIIDEQVIVVANMEPTTLFGVKSEGMILAAEDEDGMSLVTVAETMPPGSRVS